MYTTSEAILQRQRNALRTGLMVFWAMSSRILPRYRAFECEGDR
ncbi:MULTISPECIES: hypothetical protein [unclassified Nostoc]|nr:MULTISPECIES: hypothetical protein [unclassified Nostoc]